MAIKNISLKTLIKKTYLHLKKLNGIKWKYQDEQIWEPYKPWHLPAYLGHP